jgi:hypothetical protein
MMANKEKEGFMKRAFILLMVVVLGIGIFGCAGMKPAPTKIHPIAVTVDSIERLNDIAPKPPYQKWDTLVFKVNFKLSNPNDILAKVEDLYFELKVEDGTPEKTILMAGSMASSVIGPGGEIMWSYTGPYIYGGVLGSYALRGVGGEAGLKGVVGKLNELWEDLGKDKRKFFIDGNITSSLPDFPNLGTVYNQFKMEFAVPGL